MPYVPGEILIGWRSDAQIEFAGVQDNCQPQAISSMARQVVAERLAERSGLKVLAVEPAYRAGRLSVPRGQEQAQIARLSELSWVRYAEPNYVAEAASYPNDPRIGDEWNMRRIGAPAAWDVTMGSYSIAVAVVDSGVDLQHPELAGRLLPGYDYVRGDNYPEDEFGHGTHVAGILAATANNGQGIAGLAPNVKILPLKVLDSNGSGSYANIAAAVCRAADSAVSVINLSLGGLADSNQLHDAIRYAVGHNVLVVAAAGNCAQSGVCGGQTNPDFYPAAYPEVLAVGATDHFDNWTGYSGHKTYVSLSAPGGTAEDQIFSTEPNGYGYEYGTSMATPLVSAAAALVWTLQPAASAAAVMTILESTADKPGPYPYSGGRNDFYGYGRLNVERAVRTAYPASILHVTEQQYFLLDQSARQRSLRLALRNPSEQLAWWQTSVITGSSWLSVAPASSASTYGAPGILSLQAMTSTITSGLYTGTVQVRVTAPEPDSFLIPVHLQITDALQRRYLPLVPQQQMAASWFNPLDGQPLYLANNSARQLLLPFPFPFYGASFSSVWVSDNGLAFFGAPDPALTYDRNSCLPSAAAPNNAIYVNWRDWRPDLGGEVYAYQPDEATYVITWYHMIQTAGAVPQSFQLVLRRDGLLLLQYQAIESPLQGTVGTENFDGTVAQQVACDGSGRPLKSGDAVPLRALLPW